MNIAVIGLGKIGLPLAVQFADKGHNVIGIDVQERVVESVNSANEPFPGEAGLKDKLAATVSSGRLRASTDYSEGIPNADAVVIVVPLFVDDSTWEPDFRWMDQATQSLAEHLSANTLISYETTLPVGTTRNRWKPMLEAGSGLREGSDFHLVFSPERVLTGRVFADLRKYPKLVGALSDDGRDAAVEFYENVLDFDSRPDLAPRTNGVWDLGSAEAAEMAKLAETTYRDVNIALANEFSRFAETTGIDVHKVIEASNSQPYSHIHRPGIAVGGHCIPVYPRLYLHSDPEATTVRTARLTNMAMPERVVKATLARIPDSVSNPHVVVLGAAYRGGVKETAFSGVFSTVDALTSRGATVSVHDPLYSSGELRDLGFTPYILGQSADAVIIQADHHDYQTIGSDDIPGVRVVFDGRNISSADQWPNAEVLIIGDGETRSFE
ncbi:nucleotide sugar dehydrogenase [Brevibacterium sp. XM4083]|uniref:nucleotide sugar dehydrogenase n=1 Tax=Brevibacterium sp. XM4083 TaxID=2583238 RepID=UPI0011273185|nr:nucleotide sugar dehydrogenase [Brevibacterium sp. XM4083]MCM1012844.1 nucleotide sugar dehydrogenase [Brevibacterium sp. XM4083]